MRRAISKRTFLSSLGAVGFCAATSGVAVSQDKTREYGGKSLRDAAASCGVLYGAAAGSYQLGDTAFADVLSREAGILVPEYELKRGVIEAIPGRYDFSGADRLLAFAAAHGMRFRGHPLVWHHRNPDWLDDALSSGGNMSLMTDYIARVAGRYRGHVHSWDVVNEALEPKDGRSDCLRETPWLKAFGPAYIDEAYRAAREADPDVLLVYNDWGCEAGEPENDRFRAATLDFLERAKARGVPIDALGLQGHLAAFGPAIDQAKLRIFLERVRALGLKVLVTEHDVDDGVGALDIATRDRAVADASRRFLDVVLDCDATVAVLTWGLSDRFLAPESWRDGLLRGTPRKLPLDQGLARTPLWEAMAGAFAAHRKPKRNTLLTNPQRLGG